jgi:hypothetical protein
LPKIVETIGPIGLADVVGVRRFRPGRPATQVHRQPGLGFHLSQPGNKKDKVELLKTLNTRIEKSEMEVAATNLKASEVNLPKSKYSLICNSCGYSTPRHRKISSTYACTDCCNKHNNGRFTREYALQLVVN